MPDENNQPHPDGTPAILERIEQLLLRIAEGQNQPAQVAAGHSDGDHEQSRMDSSLLRAAIERNTAAIEDLIVALSQQGVGDGG